MSRDLGALRSFLSRFPAETVAPVVGIDPAAITAMAREFAEAPAASAHCSTGVNMGRHGALAYWLLQMLVLLTGNFDRAGGTIPATRGTPPAPRSGDIGPEAFVDSPWGSYRPNSGGQPGALLASMIRDGDPPIRALISTAGNPVLSIGGGEDLADALASLDLLVTVDYYRNATGELADHVLPAADWFEREDLNTFVQGTQPEPYLQWTGPIVEPAAERRTEPAIFADLTERMGNDPVFGPDADILSMLYDGALGEHGLSIDALRDADSGIALLPLTEPGTFLDRMTADGTIDGDPEMLAPARARAVELFAEAAAEPADQLKLITRRTSHTINTAMQNVERLKKGLGADNPLFVSPTDAARLGIADGAARPCLQPLRHGRGPRPHRRHPAGRRGGHDPRLRQRRHHRPARRPTVPRGERERPRPCRARHVRPRQRDVPAHRHPRRGRGRARLTGASGTSDLGTRDSRAHTRGGQRWTTTISAPCRSL